MSWYILYVKAWTWGRHCCFNFLLKCSVVEVQFTYSHKHSLKSFEHNRNCGKDNKRNVGDNQTYRICLNRFIERVKLQCVLCTRAHAIVSFAALSERNAAKLVTMEWQLYHFIFLSQPTNMAFLSCSLAWRSHQWVCLVLSVCETGNLCSLVSHKFFSLY